MLKKFLLLIILIIPVVSNLYSQEDEIRKKIDMQFYAAVSHFDEENYERALAEFNRIINNYPYNSKTTASYFFRIKILIQLKRYDEARDAINYFIENFTSSKYIDEIRMLRVKLHLDNREYYDALREIAFLIDRTKFISYRIEAKSVGEKIAETFLTSSNIEKLSNAFTGETVKPYLLLLLGKAYLREGKGDEASDALNKIINSYSQSVEYTEAKSLLDSPVVEKEPEGAQVLIGVLLPLKLNSYGEPTSKAAAEILEGIKFAVSKFNKNRTDKIGLVIRDTENSEEKIEQIRDELGNNTNIKAIIGPIFSDEVRIALREFDGTGIPIISPTATDNDLTSVSEDFFQANPPLAIRGKIMAQYIFFVENKRLMAVLNSIDGYSPLLAATFIEEFERLGGTIVAKETYKSNDIMMSSPVTKIASVDTLEGIYAPLSEKSDAPAIISLMVQDSLYVPLYGNQDWFFAKGFETSPEISNMLTFSSDFFIEFDSKSFKEFSKEFLQATGEDVNRNVLYGFDTAKYLLTVMRNVNKSRTTIKSKMISGITSQGYHNNISFDENRMNRFLNIVRYKDGVFELIEKFRSGGL